MFSYSFLVSPIDLFFRAFLLSLLYMKTENITVQESKKPCEKCKGKGWYFVNEWFGTLQGRKDCSCKKK